ncbi:VOC family protein [Phyllobacterium phragmitis]|uniref:VOC family protein n=1 Tax=Phyllobacterium phragmitis TaxID=2670329 RepID=A0ABQ0GZ74_9HYPH
MSLERIDHVQLAMPAGEKDAARRFYAGALGMIEVPKSGNLARRGGCWFEAGDVRVHLGVQGDFHPATKAHPAFIVDDLASLCARLDAAGFPCRDGEPLEGYHRAYVSDPFGNRIELMEVVG